MNRADLFLDVSETVEAYRKILTENGIKPTAETDWASLPILTKKSYLMGNPVNTLCRNGDMSDVHLIGASSGFGKSGTVYWPKRHQDEAAYLESMGAMFIANYHTDEKRTLILVCLAFGMWIAGMQLAAGIRMIAADKSQKITCATPGLNLSEAVEVIKEFGGNFDQILVITNPSNVYIFMALLKKANIDTGRAKFSFPVIGEFFSESARIRTAEYFRHDKENAFCLWTGYGSADTGGIGAETIGSVALRKFFYADAKLSEEFFGTHDTPMILETSPEVFIEIVDGEIVVTKDQFIPLIRYNTQDRGGILKKDELKGRIPDKILNGVSNSLLFVGGRTSDSVVFYGTNLIITDINNFLNGLEKEFCYGGLFQVQAYEADGVQSYRFYIYTDNFENTALSEKYYDALLGYLKNGSLEFAAKYDTLSKAAGRPLITIELKDVETLKGSLKHRFIVE